MYRLSFPFAALVVVLPLVVHCPEPKVTPPVDHATPDPPRPEFDVRQSRHLSIDEPVARDPKAALRRLAKIKKAIKQQSPAAFLEAARSADGQQNFKEARDAYRGLFLHHTEHPEAAASLELATRASTRLGRHTEGLEFFEDGIELVRGRVAEARLLRLLGNTYLSVPHYGTEKGGELHRGRYDQGKFRYTYDSDRRSAVRHLEAARTLYGSFTSSAAVHAEELETTHTKARTLLQRERIETQFDLINALAKFTPFDAGWYYWYAAWDDVSDDRADEHGADERAGRWGGYDLLYRAQPRGVPVNTAGDVVFTARPERYDRRHETTAKLKYLLHEITELDRSEDRADTARAKLQRALIFEARHGAARLHRLSRWWWMGETPFRTTIDETPLYELDDDQVFGLVATHIARYRVPNDESTLALLVDVIEKHANTDSVHDAYVTRAAFFQSRQQYKRAIAAYEDYVRAFPKGRRLAEAKAQIENLLRPEAVSGQTGVQVAGQSPRMDIEHRNIETVFVEAQRMDVEKAARLHEASIVAEKEVDYAPQNLAHTFYRDAKVAKQVRIGEPVKFERTVEDDGTHRYKKSTIELPIKEEGMWVVTLFADAERKRRVGRGIVSMASLAIVEKGDTKGPFMWVVDARTGQPVSGAKVRTLRYTVSYKDNKRRYHHEIVERRTDADGIVRQRRRGGPRVVTVQSKGRFAIAHEGYWWGYSPTRFSDANVALVYTDRPVYRPADTVKIRSWVRRRVDGVYAPGAKIKNAWVRIWDAKGTVLTRSRAVPDASGGISFSYKIPKDAPLGLFTIGVEADGRSVQISGNQFRVEEYKAPEFEVNVELGAATAKLGAKIPVTINATYLFGGGVSGAKVKYKILRSEYDHRYVAPARWDWLYGPGYGRCYYAYPWLSWWSDWGPRPWTWYSWWGVEPKPRRELVTEGEGRLDDNGEVRVTIDTTRAKQLYGDKDQRFTVEAEVVDETRRTIVGEGEVIATRHAFHVSTFTERGYHHTGETASLHATVTSFDGAPVVGKSGRFEVAAIRYEGANGADVTEEPVFTKSVTTDERGKARAKWDAQKPGQYRLNFVTKDTDGERVLGSSILWVWGASMNSAAIRFNHLQVISDKRTYAIGETAKLLVSSDVDNASILFSSFVDGGAMEKPRVIRLTGKTHVVEIPITKKHVPNFFVEAVVVGEGKLSEDVRELFVPPPASTLNVELTPSAPEFRAGKTGKLEIKTTTDEGAPVSADVAVSVFDRAVLYIQPELTPDIRKVFWGNKRRHRGGSASNLRVPLGPFERAAYPHEGANHLLARFQQDLGGLGTRGSGRGGGGYGRGSLAKDSSASADLDASVGNELQGGKREARRNKAKGRRLGDDDAKEDLRGDKSGRVAPVQPRVRKNFADTAAWRVVKTNAKGRASIDWTFPDNLTTWRIKAVAASDDMRVGQATTSVVTTKKLLVQLQAPRFFRERDRVAITAVVHNRLADAEDVEVKLDVTDALLEREGPPVQRVRIESGGKKRVDFWVNVRGEGEAKVRISALTGVESDAKELTFPVLVHGIEKTDAAAGSIPFGSGVAQKSITIEVPAARRVERTELVVRTAPSLAMAMIDALPFLLAYPYGCTEQTMSRFVPAAVTKKTLQQAGGLDLAALEKIRASLNPQALNAQGSDYDKRREHDYRRFSGNPIYDDTKLNEIIRAGLRRIAKLQNGDGGWGWWGSDQSSPYTTAYVLYGLAEARDADVPVSQAMINRGLGILRQEVGRSLKRYEDSDWISDTDAFMAYVIGRYETPSKPLLDRLYERRIRLSVYGKSLLAMALWSGDRKEDARVVLRNAAQFVRTDDENDSAWIETSQNGWWYWYNGDIESNAMFLRALVSIRPNDPLAPRLIKWLLNHRQNGWYWRSTRDTAVVLSSFGAYLRARRVQDTNYDLEVLIDGKVEKSVHIDRTNLLTFDGELRIRGADLSSGKHTITFRRKGQGAVFFNTYLTYFTLEEDVTASGLEIKVERKYFRLVRDDRRHAARDKNGQQQTLTEVAYRKEPLTSGDRVQSGDLLLVQLQLESKNDYTFLAFEDPKPAGAEPVALRSGHTYGEAVANMELRDDRVVFFLTRLAQGKLHLEYRLRAEIPGTFHTMPTRGFAMYAPELRATSSEIRIGVDDPK